jgi:hypothetical protein
VTPMHTYEYALGPVYVAATVLNAVAMDIVIQ